MGKKGRVFQPGGLYARYSSAVPEPPIKICACCQAISECQFLYNKWGYDIFRCQACGVGATQTPEGFDPASIYDEGYFQGVRSDGYADYLGSEPVIRAEFRRLLSDMLRFVPSEGRLLEVGCAYGFFLLEAQRYFRCMGVEISETAAAFCRSRGLDVNGETLDSSSVRERG